jgi:S1 RNA binding domain protein
MQLEVGTILEGKVTGITKFGAFVELPEGKTGMVHISEVAPTFVKEIRDYVTENQMVKVKVLSISDDGKVSLSMKKAVPPPPRDNSSAVRQQAPRSFGPRSFGPRSFGPRPSGPRPAGRPGSYEWQASKKPEATSFEEMMSRFKQTSDEKMSDLKKGIDSKRGGFTKHGGPSK